MNSLKILFFVYILFCIFLILSTPSETWTAPERIRGGSILWVIMWMIGIFLGLLAFRKPKENNLSSNNKNYENKNKVNDVKNIYNDSLNDEEIINEIEELNFLHPSREFWGKISFKISKGLEEFRIQWFISCIKFLKDEMKFETCNNRLNSDAEYAIKAYQLYLTSFFIEQMNYIPSFDGNDFADILYAQVCGTDMDKIYMYHSAYCDYPDLSWGQFNRFCRDVTEFIIGKNSNYFEAGIAMGGTFITFLLMNNIIVADAFGDAITVREFTKKLDEQWL